MDHKDYQTFIQHTAPQHTVQDHAQQYTQYSTGFQQAHPAQSELVNWLQQHRAKTGIIGKRSAIERHDFEQANTQTTVDRRKVTVKYKQSKG